MCTEIPARYAGILSPESLQQVMDRLETAANEIMLAVDPYDDKKPLLKEKARLETEIKLKEATAIMDDPSFMTLKNDKQRDAFRRVKTAKERTELASIEGRLAVIDCKIAEERANRENITTAAACAQRKAELQSALLGFLGGK